LTVSTVTNGSTYLQYFYISTVLNYNNLPPTNFIVKC